MESENPILDVSKDVSRALKRAHGAKALETRSELVNNVYPLIQQLIVAVEERFQRSEAAIEHILDEEEDVDESRLEPELAAAIRGVFTLGAQLGEMLVSLIPQTDDLARKRAAEAVAKFADEASRVSDLIEDATLVDEEAEEELGDDEAPAPEAAQAAPETDGKEGS